MSRRLLIGTDTIISTDPSETRINGSAPTDADVRLWQHPDDTDYYRHYLDSDGNALTAVRIRITGDSGAADADAAAQTVLDDLSVIIRSIRSRAIKFEYSAGNDRYVHPTFNVEEYGCEAEVVATGRAIRLDCRFIAVGSGGPDDGSPDGATAPLIWTLTPTPGGFFIARGQTEFESRSTMEAWIDNLKGGTHPSWMGSPSKYRFFAYEPEFRDKTSGYSGDQKHFVTVELKQQIPSLINNPDCANLVDFSYVSTKHRRGPNTKRGKTPGHDVTISGTLHFKVGAVTDFDPDDSVVTAQSDIETEADAAIDAIIGDVASKYPYALREISRKGGDERREGTYEFDVSLVMPEDDGDELFFRERVRLSYEAGGVTGRRSDGSKKLWPNATGMDVILTHSLTIRSFRRPSYRLPQVTNGLQWQPVGGEQNDPEPESELHGSGEVVYNLDAETTWERMAQGEADAVPPPSIDAAFNIVDYK